MRGRRGARGDRGETLVEVVMTITIISITVAALVSALGSVANAGNTQRAAAQADVVLRNYAEAIKLGAQTCTAGATYSVGYVPPTNYSVSVSPTGWACPAVTTTGLLTLTVNAPSAVTRTMQIRVRTP